MKSDKKENKSEIHAKEKISKKKKRMAASKICSLYYIAAQFDISNVQDMIKQPIPQMPTHAAQLQAPIPPPAIEAPIPKQFQPDPPSPTDYEFISAFELATDNDNNTGPTINNATIAVITITPI